MFNQAATEIVAVFIVMIQKNYLEFVDVIRFN